MPFKLGFSILLPGLLANLVLLSGCDYFLDRQGPAKSDVVELKAGEMGCLSGLPSTMKLWLNDEASEKVLVSTFDCLRTTIHQFEKFTRGKTRPDWYGADELLSFLNEILGSQSTLPPAFMHELLKFKSLALGGTSDGMTVQEIRAARKLMDTLQKAVILNRGSMKYLLFQGSAQKTSAQQGKLIQENIKNSILEILQLNPKGSDKYSFTDFQLLVQQFNLYLGETETLSQFLRWFPFSQSIKNVFVGQDPSLENEKAWHDYVQWGLRAYAIALDFYYNIKPLNFEEPEHWNSAISWVDNIFDWIDVSPAMNRRGSLSMTSVNEVLQEVMRSGLFAMEVEQSLIVETACRAVLNLFDGPTGHRRQCFELESLSSNHYRFLKFEWKAWVLAQQQINLAFAQSKTTSWGQYRTHLQKFDPAFLINDLNSSSTEKTALKQTFKEWQETIDGKFPIVWGADHRLLLKRVAPEDQLGFGGMTVANGIRTVTRFILRGYGEGTGTNSYTFKVSEQSFVNLESDFQQIGIAVRFLDNRSGSTAKRAFKEANFLTFSGDGGKLLDAQEFFELVNLLSSAGHQMAHDAFDRAVKVGCATKELDEPFKKPYLREGCFLKLLRRDFAEIFKAAPGLVALRKTQGNTPSYLQMEKNLREISKSEYTRENLIEFSEIRTLIAVLMYAETIRVVYDENGDLKLNEAEVRKAAPRFKGIVEQHSPLGARGAESIFACLVFGQKKPSFDWNSAGCFLYNSLVGYDTVMVPELVKVLAVLKQDMVK